MRTPLICLICQCCCCSYGYCNNTVHLCCFLDCCAGTLLLLFCFPHHPAVILKCCYAAIALWYCSFVSLRPLLYYVLRTTFSLCIFLCRASGAALSSFFFAGRWQDVYRRYRLRQRRLPQGKPVALQVHNVIDTFMFKYLRCLCGKTVRTR